MIRLIPAPRHTTMTDARVAVAPVYTADAAFADAAATLVDYARCTHSITLTEGDGGITFTVDEALPTEAYVLTVTESGAVVKASDVLGAQNAAVTLIQLMQKEGGGLSLPVGDIEDEPACSWRTIMIDLARDWHELHVLYEYVDMCRFYKVKYLHLHFTDDQSYTLPSRAFPKLPTEGRHYTEEEIRGVIAYAKARGVELIPEIDVPGHAYSFAAAYGEIFGRDGIICLSKESMVGMAALFREMCELFEDSAYIHLGGDEAAIARWTTCEKCLTAFREKGVDVDKYLATEEGTKELSELMYATFIKDICEVILSCGKTPVVWEGFHKSMNHLIPKESVIVSWENFFQTAPELLEAGFRVVNGAWKPMYVVTPRRYWSPEEVYNWNIYTWGAVHPGSPYNKEPLHIQPTMQVEGGQLLAWGDWIMANYENVAEGVREEQRLMEERTPCLSENVWNRVKPTDWAEFSGRMAQVSELYETFRNNK
ncbi:MAG: family 20 glycosylhydrolase [Clostridia bacterium]|nr:family 20 glycosylhydrolase [Clostridia bacterium]